MSSREWQKHFNFNSKAPRKPRIEKDNKKLKKALKHHDQIREAKYLGMDVSEYRILLALGHI